MDLKRAMLLRLARKNAELYPNDAVKREDVYNKYKVVRMCSLSHTTFVGSGEISAPTNLVIYQLLYKAGSCVKKKKKKSYTFLFLLLPSEQQFEIPEEEAEWLGLSLEEAVEKQRQLEHKVAQSLNTTKPAVLPESKLMLLSVLIRIFNRNTEWKYLLFSKRIYALQILKKNRFHSWTTPYPNHRPLRVEKKMVVWPSMCKYTKILTQVFHCSQSSYSVLRLLTLVLFLALQEPDPLFKACVDKLVEELHVQKLSEPHLIEKKWLNLNHQSWTRGSFPEWKIK